MRDDLKARLLTEGLAAHLEHRRELLRGCTFEEQVEYIAGPANTRELPSGWSCVTVMAYPSHLFESRWDEDRDRISCVNAHYAFDLLRSRNSGQVELARYRANAPIKYLAAGRVDEYKQLTLEQFYVHDALPVLTVNYVPLELFLKHEGLQWKDVRNEYRDDGERVVLEFTGNVGLTSVRFLSGTIAFSPGRSWAIDEFRMLVADKDSASQGVFVQKRVEWSEVDGLAVPVRGIYRFYPPTPAAIDPYSGEHTHEIRHTYRNWERTASPDERFTLSHYGRSESAITPDEGCSLCRLA